MADVWLCYAPSSGFVRWMAAHPGWVICSILSGRRAGHGAWSLLMERREP